MVKVVQVVLFKKMDLPYFNKIIKEIFNLEKLGVITIIRFTNYDYQKLKLYNSFPDDFKYFLQKVGCVQISLEDRYLLIAIMIEEVDQDDFDFLDFWTENSSLRLDSNKIFIARNVDSAFYAYHINENPVKIHEYCFSDRTYNNIFELLDDIVIEGCKQYKL